MAESCLQTKFKENEIIFPNNYCKANITIIFLSRAPLTVQIQRLFATM